MGSGSSTQGLSREERHAGGPMNIAASETGVRLVQRVQSSWKAILATLGIVFLIILVGVGVWLTLPSGEFIDQQALDSFEGSLDNSIRQSMGNFQWWYKSNILIQFTLITTSVLATVTAAITTSENANAVKKYAVVFTAVTAALASAQQTFHIRDNISSFITATGNLELLKYEYIVHRSQLEQEFQANAGNSDKNKDIPPALLQLQQNIMKKYVDIETDRMRAWASIGQQTTPLQASPPSPPR
jgi:hypothetical protein